MTIVRVRECRCISVPVVLVFVDVISSHGEDLSVVTFELTVRLWVIRGGEDVRDFESRTNSLEEYRGEPFSVI